MSPKLQDLLAVLVLATLFSSHGCYGYPAKSKIKVANGQAANVFVDVDGRVRVFRGLNRVEKQFPWYPPTLLDDKHLDNLQSWGFNVIRLGMMWSGVATGPYVVNSTYLSIMDKIIDNLGKRGIYVILDMHQDVLSSKFGSYDGAPLWLVNSLPKTKHPYPWPLKKKPASWGENYVTYAVGEAFENIYQNKSGAVDHLIFFWQTVAKRYGQKYNVLGYELINEPWPGNVFSDPLLFFPAQAGSKNLQPLYDQLADAIDKVDKKTMIFYEPVTWGMILTGKTLGSGFTHVPGGDKMRDRAVFSYHYYCWFAGSFDKNPFPIWLRDLCDHLFFPHVIETVVEDTKATGGGMFLTEFGLCNANAPKTSTEYQECLSVLRTTDMLSLSWTYWDSEFYFANGSINTENVELFSRPYAMAIEGQPLLSQFDSQAKVYQLAFIPTPNSTTFIFVPDIHYPHGYTATSSSCSSSDDGKNFVKIYCPPQSKPQVTVVVAPKK